MAARIERLSSWDAHRLVAAQVVPDVGTAVKELVENALDAGARSIEVKLINAGLDALVVVDDGAGIAASNFAAVARLHATSKLERWEQLAGTSEALSSADVPADNTPGGIRTFGFRGEALSSLCALSEQVLILTSNSETAPRGTLLSFTPEGELNADGIVAQARPRGTTVTVTNLFARLPVRQREAQKHSRRDLTRVLHWITAYALIAPDVRWICSNTPKNGRRQILLQLTPAKSVPPVADGPPTHYMANASGLLGKKAASGLLPVHMTIKVPVPQMASARKHVTRPVEDNEDDEELPAAERLKRRIRRAQQAPSSESTQSDTDGPAATEAIDIVLDGLVSRPARSYGQRTNAAQYYYLNGRPWDAPASLVKAFNDVWRSFHTNDLTTTSGSLRGSDLASSTTSASHVFPFVLAHFSAPGAATDTTLSKDKRTMHLLNERGLVDALRSSLESFYSPLRATYAVQPSQSQASQTSLRNYRCLGHVDEPSSRGATADPSTQLLSRLRSRVAGAPPPAHHAELPQSDALITSSDPPLSDDMPVSDAAVPADEMEDVHTGCDSTPLEYEATLEAGPEVAEPDGDVGEEQGEVLALSSPGTESDDSDAMLTERLWCESQTAARERSQQDELLRESSSASRESLTNEMETDDPSPSQRISSRLHQRPNPSVTPELDEISPEPELLEPEDARPEAGHSQKRGALAAASALREGFQSRRLTPRLPTQVHVRPRTSARSTPIRTSPPVGTPSRQSECPTPVPARAAHETLQEPRGTKRSAARVDSTSQQPCSASDDQEDAFVDEILVDPLPVDKHASAHSHGHGACGCSSAPRSSSQVDISDEDEANQTILVPSEEVVDSDGESVDQPRVRQVEGSTVAISLDALCSLVPSPRPSMTTKSVEPAREDRRAGAAEAAFDNPDTAAVERALSRTIAQDDFLSMQVVGQFNHAFIIVRRSPSCREACEDDLFIVDQHAADEKANFERLTRNIPVRTQSLLVPRTLELSAADELVAEEHLPLLRESGFGLVYHPTRAPGTRIELVAQPVVAGVTLGPPDLDELLSQLANMPRTPLTQSAVPIQTSSQASGREQDARWTAKGACSKARAALAMRACRSSIMVGTPLERDRMQRVVAGLAGLDMPWNCPHGRPTMRHLLDLHDPALGLGIHPSSRIDWAAFAEQ